MLNKKHLGCKKERGNQKQHCKQAGATQEVTLPNICNSLNDTQYYGLMYNADWTHGLDSRTGLSNFAGNDFKAIIQMFYNSCNTRDTIIAL